MYISPLKRMNKIKIMNLKLSGLVLLIPAILILIFTIPFSKDTILNPNFGLLEFLNNCFQLLVYAFVEEILCRYLIQRNLYRFFNNCHIPIIISSIVFSLLHLVNPNWSYIALISYFFGGLMYGYCYYFFRNLVYPTLLHFSWNIGQVFLTIPMSGEIINGYLKIQLPKNEFLFGGIIGIESGILSIIIRILIIVLLVQIKRNSAQQ